MAPTANCTALSVRVATALESSVAVPSDSVGNEKVTVPVGVAPPELVTVAVRVVVSVNATLLGLAATAMEAVDLAVTPLPSQAVTRL